MRTTRNKRILALLTSVLLCLSVVATGLAATVSVFAADANVEVTITYETKLPGTVLPAGLTGGNQQKVIAEEQTDADNTTPLSKDLTFASGVNVAGVATVDPAANATFKGWRFPGVTDLVDAGAQVPNLNLDVTSAKASVTATAVWEVKATFSNGTAPAGMTVAPGATIGTGGVITDSAVKEKMSVTKPTADQEPSLTGTATDSNTYEFKGWSTTTDADDIVTQWPAEITKNTTFTAIWGVKDPETWNVTFDLNKFNGTPGARWQTTPSEFSVTPKSPTTVVKGAKLNTAEGYAAPVAKSAAEKARYEFLGWNIMKNGEFVKDGNGNVEVFQANALDVTGDLDLYAVWKDKEAPTNGNEAPANSYSFTTDLRTLKTINLPTGTSVTSVGLAGLYLSKDLTEAELKAELVKKLNDENRVRTNTGRVHTVTSVELADAVAGKDVRVITKLTFADLPTLDVNNSWLVSFQSREGRFPNGGTQINFRVPKGDTIYEAIAPTWAGHKFLYWADPNEGTGSATLPNAFQNGVKTIGRDTVFIPVWQAVDNTPGTAAINVRFHANGGRIVDKDGDVHTALTGPMIINMPKDTKLNNEDLKALIGTVYPPANIVDGSQFVGWSKTATNQTLVPADYVLNTNDENLYAMFKQPITVTLHATPGSVFNEAGTSVASRTEKLPYGSTTLEILNKFYPNIVAPLGKVVAGLSFSSNGSQLAFDQRHNGNTTVWAVYADAIAVAFDANGGTLNNHAGYNEMILRDIPEGMSLGNLKLLMGDNFPTVTPPAGKTFLGWSISANYANAGSVVDNSFVLTRTTTRLFASYKDAVTVTFDAAPGRFIPGVIAPTSATSHVITTAKGTALNTVELPTVEAPTGKGLRGWATSRENADKGITVPVNTTLDATQTLYAVYGEPFLTVIFDATAGGTFEGGAKIHTNNRVDKDTLLKDVSVPKVTANQEGYRLAGWATSPANAENGVLLATDFKITEGMTLFAAFEEGEDEDDSSSDDSSSDADDNDDDDDSSSNDGSSNNNGSVGVSNSTSTGKGGVGPKTGDNSMMLIGMIALILAGSGIATGVVVYKKRKEQE